MSDSSAAQVFCPVEPHPGKLRRIDRLVASLFRAQLAEDVDFHSDRCASCWTDWSAARSADRSFDAQGI